MKNQNILIPIGQSPESHHILNHISNFFPPEVTKLVLIQVTEKPDSPTVADTAEVSGPNTLTTEIDYQMQVGGPPLSPVDAEELGIKDMESTVYTSQVEERHRYEVQDILKEITGPLRKDGYEVSTVVRFGNPAEEILTYLERQDEAIDLVAMTTHGRSGLDRLIKGSVAEEVLRNTKLPILLAQPPAEEA